MKYSGRSVIKPWITQGLVSLAATFLVPALWAQGVLTWHNDAARTGQNLQETILSPSNVNSTNFGLLHTLSVDSTVDAQPLYVPALSIAGGTHNVLYVVTENDTVYAFDADAGGTALWSQSVLGSGETASDTGCGQVFPTVGITSTPVIDLTSGPHGTIYLVAMTKDSSNAYHHRLHALDLVTHAEEFGGPLEIAATYPNNSGGVTFVASQYKERAALVLSNGVIYTSWASNCDGGTYSAWVIGYSESSLAKVSTLNLTPNGQKGAIWQAGSGPAVDAAGNLYFLMANGTFDTTLTPSGFPMSGDYGNAFMNLSTTSGLAVADYFTMDNTVTESGGDEDLGSGGAMLLPILNDALGNPHELAVGAGKDGNAYVVDRNNMGKFNMSSNAVFQQLGLGGGVFSSPAWFNNTLYYGPTNSSLSAYTFTAGSFGFASQTSHSFGYRGVTPSISANGATNGIVWASDTPSHGSAAVLYAYDATNLGTELYDSTQAASSRDSFGTGITFAAPTAANGKVYVGTTNGVGVFGLLNCSYSLLNSVTFDSGSNSGSIVVTASPTSCSWGVSNSTNFITITGVTSGVGGTVSFSVPPNPGASRVGVLVIAGQVVKVTQNGADTLIPAPSNPTPANGATGISFSPTLSWTGSTGATSYDVYFGTSPSPLLATNTASTNYGPGTLSPGITYYWRVVAKNGSGTNSSPVWAFTTTNTTPVSVTPSSGSGSSHTFAFVFSDTAGAADITAAQIGFNTVASGSSACWMYYAASTQTVYLANDAGAFQNAGLVLGSAGTLTNSQCTVNVNASSVNPSGNALTLNLALTFAPAFAGAKNTYMYVKNATFASAFVQEGTWTVSNPAVPSPVSVTPSSGSGSSHAFAFVFSDTAGAADITAAQIGFNTAASGSSACWMYYAAGTQTLYLANDAGAFQNAGLVLGSAGTLQNSQCTVNVNASSASPSGNTLTVNLALSFAPAFAGAKNTYMYVKNASVASSFVQEGTWTVPGATGPAPVSVTPNSGSGSSHTFAFAFSDSAGAADITAAQIGFNTAASGSNACWMYYAAGTQTLYLANDAGAFQTGGLVLGSAGTLQNSQCTVNVNASSASPSGNTLTVNLALTFAPAFAGAKNIYMYVQNSTLSSGFMQEGTWTVTGATGPVPVSVTPNSGSGTPQTFAFAFSDSAGAADIKAAQLGFNTVVSGSNACWMYYAAATQTLYLANDAGAFQNAGLVLGSMGTLTNSQCTVNVSTSTASPMGNTLTLNLSLSFSGAFVGSKNTYMYVQNSTLSSGFVQEGTWTP